MAFTVDQILAWTSRTGGRLANADVLGAAKSSLRVERPVPLASARRGHLAFFFNRAYQAELATAMPSVLITAEPFLKPLEASGHPLWKECAVIACADPYLAMADLSEHFARELSTVGPVGEGTGEPVVHATAIVSSEAQIGAGVRIGAYCVVEKGAKLASGVVLYPNCYIGPEVEIGAASILFPGVTVYEWTRVGARARIHAGTVIGSDGFGYAPMREGTQVKGHQKIFHLGRVWIGDDVEMGANCCIDRATFGETRIADQVKLDNDVHVGHNARLDTGAVVCGGTALAGRASIGKFAYVGGLTGITNDVHVGDGAQVGAVSLVTKDVAPGSSAVGAPAREYEQHFRIHAMLNRMLAQRRKT